MSGPILSTKLFIPPTTPNLVPRPRLIERLNEALRLRHKLILISAPAFVMATVCLRDPQRLNCNQYAERIFNIMLSNSGANR